MVLLAFPELWDNKARPRPELGPHVVSAGSSFMAQECSAFVAAWHRGQQSVPTTQFGLF